MTHNCCYRNNWIVFLIILVALFFSGLFMIQDVQAAEHPILYLFWGEGCPHCEEEKVFLRDLQQQYPELEMRWFEVWKHPEFAQLANLISKAYNVKAASVPMTFLGEWTLTGFRSPETSGEQIRQQLEACLQEGCIDPLDKLGPHQLVLKIQQEVAENAPQGWEYFPAKKTADQQSKEQLPVSERKIVVYYFHGNSRCASCMTIEQYTRKAVEEAFASELKSSDLELKVINVETPENAHFIKDYQLYTRSVILSDVKEGKETRWKNLQKVWELLRDEQAFKDYVQMEVFDYLEEQPS